MKNTFKYLIIVLFVSAFASCDKDDSTDDIIDDKTGSYEINIDGKLFDKGENVTIGLIQDANKNWTNNVTFGTNIVTVLSQFPKTIGSTTELGTNGDPGLAIAGSDVYYTISGKLKRESETKVSFEGICSKMLNSQEYTISGFVKTEALKKVK
jgi:hypothetical protein